MFDIKTIATVLELALQVKKRTITYADLSNNLENCYDNPVMIDKAPYETLMYIDREDGIIYFVIGATNWSQRVDREANFDINPHPIYHNFYEGYYNKAERAYEKITECIAEISGTWRIVIGGFSQGAAIAQLLGLRPYGIIPKVYCIASPRVAINTQPLNPRIWIINHPQDPVRLFPIMGKYVGQEYFLDMEKYKIQKVNKFKKLWDFMTRDKKFDGDMHDERYYLQCIKAIAERQSVKLPLSVLKA